MAYFLDLSGPCPRLYLVAEPKHTRTAVSRCPPLFQVHPRSALLHIPCNAPISQEQHPCFIGHTLLGPCSCWSSNPPPIHPPHHLIPHLQGIRFPITATTLPALEVSLFLDFCCPFSRKVRRRRVTKLVLLNYLTSLIRRRRVALQHGDVYSPFSHHPIPGPSPPATLAPAEPRAA